MSGGGPLDGLLVVSLEQAVAAPWCTSRLADAGARVIKIERREGDFARGYDGFAKGQSAYFVWLNRGKESVILDLKDATELAWLKRMLAKADVLVQNLAPGALDRAGLSLSGLREAHPRLIACSISGYGTHGPYRDRKAYDLLLQAETGMASITGSPEAPGRIGVSGCDIACGMYAHAAILEALIARGISGQGRSIEVSLFDAMADWMAVPLMQYEGTGAGPSRVGLSHSSIAPYGLYAAGDGASVLLSIQNPREWTRFCAEVLRDAELAVDPRFAGNVDRVRHRAELDLIITKTFSRYDRAGLLAALGGADIAFGMLNGVAELAEHPHLRRVSVETAGGTVQAPAPPAIVDAGEVKLGPVPELGSATERVRREFAA